MLYQTADQQKRRVEVMQAYKSEEISREEASKQLLSVDDSDFVGLLLMVEHLLERGEADAAEAAAWRGAEAHPYHPAFYLELSRMLMQTGGSVRGIGLVELGSHKLEIAKANKITTYADVELPQISAQQLRALRAVEDAAMQARLRPHRLIDDLLAASSSGLSTAFLREIVRAGGEIVPYLIGVLRGWVNDQLPVRTEAPAKYALALLGEIADPRAIVPVLQCALDSEEDVAGAARWSWFRIARRNGARVATELEAFLPYATDDERDLMADFVSILGDGHPARALLARLPQPSAVDADLYQALDTLTLEDLCRVRREEGRADALNQSRSQAA